MKRLASGAALGLGLLLSGAAQAVVIDFNLPANEGYLGTQYSQDGFTLTNSGGLQTGYGNWVALGYPQYNAAPTADIFQDTANTTNTLTADSGAAFSFQSIALANVFNNGGGGEVQFTFNHADGASNSQTVTLASGVYGLQTFTFDQSNLSSVAFTATTTQGTWVQFDDIGVNGDLGGGSVNGAVPEPASWTMMLVGLGALGAILRRRAARAPFAA